MFRGRKFIPDALREKKRKKAIYKYIATVFLLFIILFCTSLILSNTLIIDSVKISGTKIIEESDISKTLENYLEKRKFLIFPNKNILSYFLYSRSGVEKNVKNQFAAVAGIKTNLSKENNFRILDIEIVEKKAMALKCENLNKCFYVDINGEAFAPAPEFSDLVYIKLFGFIESTSATSSLSVAEALDFAKSVRGAGLSVEKIVFQEGDNYAFIVRDGRVPVSNLNNINDMEERNIDYISILINRRYPLQKVLSNLLAVIEKYPKSQKIDYIDLRFGDNIVVKPLL